VVARVRPLEIQRGSFRLRRQLSSTASAQDEQDVGVQHILLRLCDVWGGGDGERLVDLAAPAERGRRMWLLKEQDEAALKVGCATRCAR